MQFIGSAMMDYEPLCFTNMVSVRVMFFSVFILVSFGFLYFGSVFDKQLFHYAPRCLSTISYPTALVK